MINYSWFQNHCTFWLSRSRPVMDLEVSLKLTQKEIPVESNITNCKDDGESRRW